MIPRVFVSSTYYDLKHVRERIEKFIKNYGFEPVLFESDKVTYEFGKPIDQSAYYEVGLCHIMVLIIGGRYGSPSSTQLQQTEIINYNEGYVSITRRELETALNLKIPIIIFIEKNVYAEYHTYKENKDLFEEDIQTGKKNFIQKFKFAHVDDVNIFRFIDSVSSIACKTFDKVEEIEVYLKAQFAGLFYLYLESLKKNRTENQILNTVNQMNNLVQRMNEMVESVGKKVLSESEHDYRNVVKKQFKIVLDFFAQEVYFNLEFNVDCLELDEYKSVDFQLMAGIFCTYIFWNGEIYKNDPKKKIEENWSLEKEAVEGIIAKINSELFDNFRPLYPKVAVKNCNVEKLYSSYVKNVEPFLIEPDDKESFKECIQKVLDSKLDLLPF